MGKIATRAATVGKVERFEDSLLGAMDKLMATAPEHIKRNQTRFAQLAISTCNRIPKLKECDLPSLLGCFMKCSTLGLEPSEVDGLGRAYILPFYNGKARRMEATFILGYRGMIDLARRSGKLKSIEARAVYAGDVFEFEFGLSPKLRHVPGAGDRTADRLTHVYMVAFFSDGGSYYDVMTRAEVEAVRKRSKASNSGPWVTDFEAMAKKTVIRRAFPYLPVSVEDASAVATEEAENLAEAPSFGPIAAEVEGVEDAAPEDGKTAPEDAEIVGVCRSCGYAVNAAPDATADDLNAGASCCDNPDYVISGVQ